MQQTSEPNLQGQRSEVNMCFKQQTLRNTNNKYLQLHRCKVNIKKGGFKNWIVI